MGRLLVAVFAGIVASSHELKLQLNSSYTPIVLARFASLAIGICVAGTSAIAWARPPSLARETHVYGPIVSDVSLHNAKGALVKTMPFASLARTELAPGPYEIRMSLPAGDAVELPPCSGTSRVSASVAGKPVTLPGPGPVVTRVVRAASSANENISVSLRVAVSAYERRIACGYAPRSGAAEETRDGLRELTFDSHGAGKCRGSCTPGKALVFVPRGHDEGKPATLLVGVHPWNGSIWTYAAYQELLAAAQARDVVLLFPSGLGNSLYTAEAESEVLAAMDALAQTMPIDPLRVSLWGASMGGAGATTIGFHHPDRFATITSFFGDAKYDLGGYVRGILPNEAAAHRVNPLDAIENARHVPVWLIHGENDKTSPIRQSELLYAALTERNYRVRFDRDKQAGHDGALVAKYLTELVDLAAHAVAPAFPPRVTLKLVRPEDRGAYGVVVERTKPNDDCVLDLERVGNKVVLHAAANVARLSLSKGALGATRDEQRPSSVDYKGSAVPLIWAP
ncbi:MAG: prolyl oligopeptidase family serine peptidase [Polyangiaceae bacterium]